MPQLRLSRIALLLCACLVGSAVPQPVAAQDPPSDAQAAPAEAEPQPSIHYEDSLAHADDVIAFEPGERATVGFTPRSTDTMTVAGAPSRPLPAGRTSGSALSEQQTGETEVPADEVVDTEAPDAPAEAQPSAEATANVARREVFGFLPYWEVNSSTLRLDYRALTTIAYFGVGANSSGSLVKSNSNGTISTGWAGWTSSRMTSILNTAHQNGVRVVLTVERFSWTTSQATATRTLLSSATNRQRLANEIATAVRDRGADGVNLDFEPIPSGLGAYFVDLTRRVRAALDAKAPGYQLTVDTTGYIGNYPVTDLTRPGAADAIFIMGYDYRVGSATRAGSISPLSGPIYDLTDTVNAFLARTSADKLILGLPYYGRAWTTQTGTVRALTHPQGSTYGYSGTVLYRYARETAVTYGRHWDEVEQGPWVAYQRRNCTSCPLAWRQVYYDDAVSLARRYDMINRLGLRGAGIWALGYDGTRTELYTLLKQKFPKGTAPPVDTTGPRAGIRPLPATVPSEGILVDWTAVDDRSALAGYDVQVSVRGGPWTPWFTATGRGAATYLGRAGYGYAFRVRARDAAGNWGAWNVTSVWNAAPALAVGGFARVVASSLTLRSAADTSATAVGTATAGRVLAITGGPVVADGYRWYRVTGPLTEWGVVAAGTPSGRWVASGPSSAPWIVAAQSPNATRASSEINGVAIGSADKVVYTGAASGHVPATGGRSFSPNGDGVSDALRINYHISHTLTSLAMRVYSASTRALLGTVTLPGRTGGDHTYDWGGRLGSTVVRDGQILIQLVGVKGGVTHTTPVANMADTSFPTAGLVVTVDTVAPTVSVPVAGSPFLSPNGDGQFDSTSLAATAQNDPAAWTLTIASGSSVVRSFSGEGGTMRATWDGRDASGAFVPDGTYALRARAVDEVGNDAGTYRWLWVDTAAPAGTVRASAPGAPSGQTANAFSPNGDGQLDVASLGWSLGEAASGTLTVSRGAMVVRSAAIPSGTSGTFTWDGRDSRGRGVADGAYSVRASVVDRVGNESTLASTVVVDRTVGFLRPSPQFFHPGDADSLASSTRLTFGLTAPAYTTLRIFDGDRLVRTAWYGRLLGAGTWGATWNGRDDAGALVAPGVYRAVLHVSRSGVRHVLSYGLRLDAFAISATPATAGGRVTISAASSEPLATAPTITLTQAGVAPVSRTAVRGSDGRWRATFSLAAGVAGTASVAVAANDTLGGTNRSTWAFPVR